MCGSLGKAHIWMQTQCFISVKSSIKYDYRYLNGLVIERPVAIFIADKDRKQVEGCI